MTAETQSTLWLRSAVPAMFIVKMQLWQIAMLLFPTLGVFKFATYFILIFYLKGFYCQFDSRNTLSKI